MKMTIKSHYQQGMILPVVLLMMMVVSAITIQLLRDAIGSSKGMLSFRSYLERMHQAEKKLVQMEEIAKNKLPAINIKQSDSMVSSVELPTSGIQIIGFVPDHLEFGCQMGTYIVRLQSSPLQSYWAVPAN